MKNQSESSKDFNKMAVSTCIQSARDLVNLIPLTDDARDIYRIIPFWVNVHYIVQAASVLMLELAYRAEHVPSQAGDVVGDSKKAVLLLRSMASQSVAARKAWEVFDALLRQVAPKVGAHTMDMPHIAPFPPNWHPKHFATGATAAPSNTFWQTQNFTPAPTTTSEWVESSQFAMQPEFPPWAYSTAAETLPAQLSSLQPFHASGPMLGQFDNFGPWHTGSFADAYLGARGEGERGGMLSAFGVGVQGEVFDPFGGGPADMDQY